MKKLLLVALIGLSGCTITPNKERSKDRVANSIIFVKHSSGLCFATLTSGVMTIHESPITSITLVPDKYCE